MTETYKTMLVHVKFTFTRMTTDDQKPTHLSALEIDSILLITVFTETYSWRQYMGTNKYKIFQENHWTLRSTQLKCGNEKCAVV